MWRSVHDSFALVLDAVCSVQLARGSDEFQPQDVLERIADHFVYLMIFVMSAIVEGRLTSAKTHDTTVATLEDHQ